MGDSRITCKICKLKFFSYKKFVTHLQEIHNFSSYKEYYDKYFLEKNEDLKCPFCDKERAFDITYYKRYRDTCGDKECIKKAKNRVWKDPEKKEKFLKKSRETKLKNHGDPFYNNREKNNRTIRERYNVSNIFQTEAVKEKSVKTLKKNLNVTHPSKSPEIKKKKENTNLRVRNVKYPLQCKKCLKKLKDTTKKNWNVDNIAQNSFIQEKIQNTTLANWNVRNILQLPENREKAKAAIRTEEYKKNKRKRILIKFFNNKILKLKDKIEPLFTIDEYDGVREIYPWKCMRCKTIFNDSLVSGHIPRCPKCFPKLCGTSKPEKELQEWVEQFINIEKNKRISTEGKYEKSSFELDIFIPLKNLGIELNGIYHHSENGGRSTTSKNYHLNKTQFFLEKGIQILHIWDNEWNIKQDIVKSIILNKLNLLNNRIYARNCDIKIISNINSFSFFEENHLQGGINSKINIGLFYKNELVQVASFGKPRFNKKYDWELLRFATILNTSVIGGFSKILKYFKRNYNGSIISYADLRYSNGKVYEKNGFKLISQTNPNYYYTKDHFNLESRVKYQKHKLPKLLKEYNKNLTEWENMQLNGYDRIWDCGNLVYTLE